MDDNNIKLVYSQLIDKLGLTKEGMKKKAIALADAILLEWTVEARSAIKSQSVMDAYVKSLSIKKANNEQVQVSLTPKGQGGTLALMYELGMGPNGIGSSGPYDMRVFMLKETTRNIRRDKKGQLYLNVPFKHSAKAIKARGDEHVLKQAKKLAPRFTANAPQVSRDGSIKGSKGDRLPRGLVPKMKAHHTTDIYAGMVRLASSYSRKKDGKAVVQTSGYMTWRRMTMNQKPPKWVHPGIQPLFLHKKVYDSLPTIINRIFSNV